ncbi:transcriptional regulatory protein ResD [Gottschalkia purinilytica]|uniref:Transcriptional regulatory protein ResD n=1 Tax=Gottschalkia purinilytica TaxID=1503 RepID=A0A0L0WD46_GOTPU|nr:response regulator transcription factor [Gottschalkia purinilytica]KNF09392.1 transcriptional regulatory protein ResD [Gottschalkia purinilytica]
MYEKILIVDDEKGIVSFIKDALSDENYEILTAYNGDEAISKISLNPDLILLDIMMPGKNGYEVCKIIRDIFSGPIIFLTAKQEESDKIKGLALGGDDYIVKPFSLKELKARVNAHLRRQQRIVSNFSKSKLRFGKLSVNLNSREVYYENTLIDMTRREFDIIEVLCLHPNQVFSKELLYERVCGYDAEGNSSSIAEHVKNIRSKLNSISPNANYIKTVWGIGYRWERCD